MWQGRCRKSSPGGTPTASCIVSKPAQVFKRESARKHRHSHARRHKHTHTQTQKNKNKNKNKTHTHTHLELGTTKIPGANAKDKRDGVHEVGLARPIWSNHRTEGCERPNDTAAAIGLEVLQLKPMQSHVVSVFSAHTCPCFFFRSFRANTGVNQPQPMNECAWCVFVCVKSEIALSVFPFLSCFLVLVLVAGAFLFWVLFLPVFPPKLPSSWWIA